VNRDQRGARGDRPATAARALGDTALVEAMRHGDTVALREFLIRFEVLLEHHAHRLGASGGDRDDLVGETLEDAALALLVPNAATPRSLPAYLVASLRNRILNRRRAAGTIRRVRESTLTDRPTAEDALCSESTQRASAGPSWEPPRPSRAVASLASALLDDLGEDEQLLLIWISNHVAYRDIADWLGVGYAAVGKRVERLRARLRARAELHIAASSDSERRVLETLFTRVGPLAARMPPSALARPARAPSGAAATDGLPPDRAND
jgi:DNA-directed RNA polymerase specialized sigma24 family protein